MWINHPLDRPSKRSCCRRLDLARQFSMLNVAKALQRRSRIAQGLNVPHAYASAFRSLRPCWTSFFAIL
jgi:hypothetical protein